MRLDAKGTPADGPITMALSGPFQARGDGRQYNVMLFSGPSVQAIPSMQAFVAGPEWTQVRLPLDSFAERARTPTSKSIPVRLSRTQFVAVDTAPVA